MARKTKENGHDVNKSVKIKEIPRNCQIKKLPNSDLWLEGVPRGSSSIQLTFKDVEQVTTNSIRIDSDSLTVHQYTFDIFQKPQEPQDTKDSNEKPANSKIGVDVDESTLTVVSVDEDERRQIYNKLRFHKMSEIEFIHFYFR